MKAKGISSVALVLALALTGCGEVEKPAKADVIDGIYGMEALMEIEELASDDEARQIFSECVADIIYDEADIETLAALADGEDVAVSDDEELVTNAASDCAIKVLLGS